MGLPANLFKLSLWLWTVTIYCCLAERIALAFWMSDSIATARDALSCLLRIESGLHREDLEFIVLPILLFVIHSERCQRRHVLRAYRNSADKLIFSLNTSLRRSLSWSANIVLVCIASSFIPTIIGAGGQAVAFAAGDCGLYDFGERVYSKCTDPGAIDLGRSLVWYRAAMSDKAEQRCYLSAHDRTVLAAVYGAQSKQLGALDDSSASSVQRDR